jgi:hypothetical protein
LRRTQLAGPLRATLGLHTARSLAAELRDPHFAIQGKLVDRSGRSRSSRTLRLEAGDAQLAASGKVALVDAGKFALRGSAEEFRPQPFSPSCRRRVSTRTSTRREAAIHSSLSDFVFQLRDSHFGKEVAGRSAARSTSQGSGYARPTSS